WFFRALRAAAPSLRSTLALIQSARTHLRVKNSVRENFGLNQEINEKIFVNRVCLLCRHTRLRAGAGAKSWFVISVGGFKLTPGRGGRCRSVASAGAIADRNGEIASTASERSAGRDG